MGSIVGVLVGYMLRADGSAVHSIVGSIVGVLVGCMLRDDGSAVHFMVGPLVGSSVGCMLRDDGFNVQVIVGARVDEIVGKFDKVVVGDVEECSDGELENNTVGVNVASFVGNCVGIEIGDILGSLDGAYVDIVGSIDECDGKVYVDDGEYEGKYSLPPPQ